MNTIILYDKKIIKNTDTNILLFDLKYFIIFSFLFICILFLFTSNKNSNKKVE